MGRQAGRQAGRWVGKPVGREVRREGGFDNIVFDVDHITIIHPLSAIE